MPNPAFVKVTTSGLLYGQLNQNVLHFNNPDGALTQSAIANHIEANWIAQIKTKQVTSFIYTKIEVAEVGPAPQATFVKAINVPGTNIANADAVPFSCFVIQLKSLIAGRRGRGRFYISGLTNNSHTNGVLTAGTITAWNTTLATLKGLYGPGGSSGLTMYIKPKDSNAFVDAVAVEDLLIRQYVGVQRRRNYQVGV